MLCKPRAVILRHTPFAVLKIASCVKIISYYESALQNKHWYLSLKPSIHLCKLMNFKMHENIWKINFAMKIIFPHCMFVYT